MPVLFFVLPCRREDFVGYRKRMMLLGGVISIVSMVAVGLFSTNLSSNSSPHRAFFSRALDPPYCTARPSFIYIDEWFVRREGFVYGITLAYQICCRCRSTTDILICYEQPYCCGGGILMSPRVPSSLSNQESPISNSTTPSPSSPQPCSIHRPGQPPCLTPPGRGPHVTVALPYGFGSGLWVIHTHARTHKGEGKSKNLPCRPSSRSWDCPCVGGSGSAGAVILENKMRT